MIACSISFKIDLLMEETAVPSSERDARESNSEMKSKESDSGMGIPHRVYTV